MRNNFSDVSRHDKRKVWYGYKLTDEVPNHVEKGEIQKSIEEEFHSNGLETNVKVVMYNNITFICVKEKEKKKKTTRQGQRNMPTFFALFLRHKYFFCSKKIVSLNYIKGLAISQGYNNGRRIKLMGKDLRSLMKFLWLKEQGTLRTEAIGQPSVYQPSNPSIR